MNVLFLTLLDFSDVNESGIYTDLVREFLKEGHSVSIVSPTEKRKNRPTELIEYENVRILKLQIGNIQKTNLIEKGISTLALEAQFKAGIKKYFGDVRFDLILYSTPPITLQDSVLYVKQRDNSKTYLLLKDIFPQNAVDLNMLQTNGLRGILYKFFRNKETKLYHISDYIGCMSQANVNFLLNQNTKITKASVEVCPNSIEPMHIRISDSEKEAIRKKYDVPLEKTIFLYGGNLGKPQGVNFLMECLKANEDKENSYFVIVGSGTEFTRLQNFFNTESLKNSKLISALPKEDYELFANSCDVGLIFLDQRFTIPNFPSRLLSYMQASMPVLAATDKRTDIGKIITEGKFGYWCESTNVTEFSRLASELCNPSLRETLGKNARKHLEDHYTARHSYEIIMRHFQ